MASTYEGLRLAIGRPELNQRATRNVLEARRRSHPPNRKAEKSDARRAASEEAMIATGDTVLVRDGDNLYRQPRVPDMSGLQIDVDLTAGVPVDVGLPFFTGEAGQQDGQREKPIYIGVPLPRIDGPVTAEVTSSRA